MKNLMQAEIGEIIYCAKTL